MGKTGKPYPREFRLQMIERVRAGCTPEELASELEPRAESIRNDPGKSRGLVCSGDRLGATEAFEFVKMNRADYSCCHDVSAARCLHERALSGAEVP